MAKKNQKVKRAPAAPRRRGAVSKLVQTYLTAAKSKNTVRGYASDVRTFMAWGGRIPATAALVAQFLAEEAETKTFATVKRKSAAIAALHRERGYPNPCASNLVVETLRGIKRAKPYKPRRRLPLMAKQVIAVTKEMKGMGGLRNRALLLVGFAGAFRRAELVGLNVEDLGMREGNLVARIRASKTDQFAEGREVVIPPGRGGRSPVRALVAWLKASGITSGAVFRRVDKHGNVLDGRLRAESMAKVVKVAAERSGLGSNGYGGHSLRAGYVTEAAARGVPIWAIKRQTGHSTQTALEGYIRPALMTKSQNLL